MTTKTTTDTRETLLQDLLVALDERQRYVVREVMMGLVFLGSDRDVGTVADACLDRATLARVAEVLSPAEDAALVDAVLTEVARLDILNNIDATTRLLMTALERHDAVATALAIGSLVLAKGHNGIDYLAVANLPALVLATALEILPDNSSAWMVVHAELTARSARA